ncbi:hypothetical protein Nepgr_008907 [Nepenthes gracilis]|uniref:RING-type E3 ubiquitin transferase n=1 Tax=Nepenthes gracilis TaxID=150966 RepID=A0AAD3SAC9_NEPGR|nr:hypothetical protein Nepgr_008907 [Nepenthes gracilis]
MSTARVNATGAQAYFCYQCNRTVTLTPSPDSDLLCPNCSDGFLEELETPPSPDHSPNPNPNPLSIPMVNPFPVFPEGQFSYTFGPSAGLGGDGAARGPIVFSSTMDLENPRNLTNIVTPSVFQEVHVFNPSEFLQNHLQDIRASGASIQFVIENHTSDPGLRLPANIGDYFMGPGLEQLIQQLVENDPNRYGTPPASKKAVEGLPDMTITEELANSKSAKCAVCMNEFVLGLEVKLMPCDHIYHSDCILPWLELHNSCPVCRYELPTDDADYENRVMGNRGSWSSTGGAESSTDGGDGSQGSSQRPRIAERRFRITLPWPFSAFASSGGNNDDGTGSNNSSGGQDSGSRGQQNRDNGSEPRQENLD